MMGLRLERGESGKSNQCHFVDDCNGMYAGKIFELPFSNKYEIPEFQPVSIWETDEQYRGIHISSDSMNDIFHQVICDQLDPHLCRDMAVSDLCKLDYLIASLSMLEVTRKPLLCVYSGGAEKTLDNHYGFLKNAGLSQITITAQKKQDPMLVMRRVSGEFPTRGFEDVVLFADYSETGRSIYGGVLFARTFLRKRGICGNVYAFVHADDCGFNFSPKRGQSPNQICFDHNAVELFGNAFLRRVRMKHAPIVKDSDIRIHYPSYSMDTTINREFYTSTYFEVLLQQVKDIPLEQLREMKHAAENSRKSEDVLECLPAVARYSAKYVVEWAKKLGDDVRQ